MYSDLKFHVRIRLHIGVGDFWGASEVLLVFCERMVFHIPVMMIGVSELIMCNLILLINLLTKHIAFILCNM